METASWNELIEDEDFDAFLDQVEPDTNLEQHCCGNCMSCLGMSWRDFF